MAALLTTTALIAIFLAVIAVRKSNDARIALRDAGLAAVDLISIDTACSDFSCIRQENMISQRYGISGRPDRVIRTAGGLVPVELKGSRYPRSGPYETQLAQLAVYCLLVEERYKTKVTEGRIQYSDRLVTVDFDNRMRDWILGLVEEVREAKQLGARPMRSHNHAGKCHGCGFREICSEGLR